jgi:stage V sporulation protein G
VEITEVKVKLTGSEDAKLKAYCSITLDGQFVVRDLKIIQGAGGTFVAMPSRKLTDRCPRCRCKNHLRARYCNHCGGRLEEDRVETDPQGRSKLHADIAHPINASCREVFQDRVIEEFERERVRATEPGYVPVELYDHADYDDFSY